MDEEKLERKLRELKWKNADKDAMDRHKKKFKASLIKYVAEANRKENRKRKMRFAFTYALIGVIAFVSIFSLNRYTQKQAFYKLVFNNAPEMEMDNSMRRLKAFKLRITRIVEDKKLSIAHLYTNVQDSIIVVDLKEKKIIGVGIPLYAYDKKIHKYQSKKVYLTDSDKNKAKEIILNNSFIKRLSKKSFTVENPTIVYMYSYEKKLLYKVATVKVVLTNGKIITAFVDISRNRVLDITDTQNILGELITKDPDIHNFLYLLDKK
ncbi:MAG: hypothetical protein J7J57_06005 [Caldisericaceae bacterium]|nr:hypothetical protein [Caldisericaceae bacterium]